VNINISTELQKDGKEQEHEVGILIRAHVSCSRGPGFECMPDDRILRYFYAFYKFLLTPSGIRYMLLKTFIVQV
jgi:hypothetical protein